VTGVSNTILLPGYRYHTTSGFTRFDFAAAAAPPAGSTPHRVPSVEPHLAQHPRRALSANTTIRWQISCNCTCLPGWNGANTCNRLLMKSCRF